MGRVQAPIVPIIGDLIRQVPGTISLGQGAVHYGPPPAALDAVRSALADPSIHEYQDAQGLPSLVDRLTVKLQEENGIQIGPGRRLMVTAGGNLAFMHAVMATTQPGDEIILPIPFYFNHEMAIQMAGCRAVGVATDAQYQLQLEAMRGAITDRTRAIVTISPNNPSGAVYPEAALRAVSALCRDNRLYHISDEVYEYFTYGSARHSSPASFEGAGDDTISIYSLSKAYGMAGWRVGYFVYPEHLSPAMMKSQDTLLVCATVIAQVAAAAAVRAGRGYCAPHVIELGAVRRLVLDAFGSLGSLVTVLPPAGAFYCLAKVNSNLDAMLLAERLIREYRVAVIPGAAFGMTDGCYFRVAFGALQRAAVAEGIGRLVEGLQRIAT
jgi:aspartate/methionine/tyrosine aminotransferase